MEWPAEAEALARRAGAVAARHSALLSYMATTLLSSSVAISLCPHARAAPSLLSGSLVLCSTLAGQLALANVVLGGTLLSIRYLQQLAFGPLRVTEWHASWERLIYLTMSQLVLIGAVVEPDWGEMMLWSGLAAFVSVIALYSGVCKDRLEYMTHLPDTPPPHVIGKVIALQVLLLGSALAVVVFFGITLAPAGWSLVGLLLFQPAHVFLDGVLHFVQLYFQMAERRSGGSDASDAVYYATLIPELGLGLSRLLHHLHTWYVHGLHFSIIDVLLFASTKSAFETLYTRLSTHFNFLRADANLQRRFRDATKWELEGLGDCCAICREEMEAAKVLPCGHYFHYRCLRSWLERSHSCPICRSHLADSVANHQPAANSRRALTEASGAAAAAMRHAPRNIIRNSRQAQRSVGAITAALPHRASVGSMPYGLHTRQSDEQRLQGLLHGAYQGPNNLYHPESQDQNSLGIEQENEPSLVAVALNRTPGQYAAHQSDGTPRSQRQPHLDVAQPEHSGGTVSGSFSTASARRGGDASETRMPINSIGNMPDFSNLSWHGAEGTRPSAALAVAAQAVAAAAQAVATIDDEEEEEEEDYEETFSIFSSENWVWPSWLPRVQLEVVRRPSRAALAGRTARREHRSSRSRAMEDVARLSAQARALRQAMDARPNYGLNSARIAAAAQRQQNTARNAVETVASNTRSRGQSESNNSAAADSREPGEFAYSREMSQLREVFPHVADGALRRALLRGGSLEAAVEALLQE